MLTKTSVRAHSYRVNWELLFYLLVFAAAVLTRLVNLGDRVMSHDESLQSYFSLMLLRKGEYLHAPFMHGPLLFHITALIFWLFGDSDFTARLYPALLGIGMVLMPKLLFERWLGKYGAAISCLLILISPVILYHHRYNREDTPAVFFVMVMVYAIFAYLDGKQSRRLRMLLWFTTATLLALASKETTFFHILIFLFALVLFGLFQMTNRTLQAFRLVMTGIIVGTLAALLMVVILSILPLKLIAGDQALLNRLILWTGLGVTALASAIVIPTLIHFKTRLPLPDLATIGIVGLVAGVILTGSERLASLSYDTLLSGIDPGHENTWIIGTWIVSGVCFIILLALRYLTRFFEQARQYPAFDLLIVLGTLVLPWFAAIPVYYADYDVSGSVFSANTINVCFLTVLPLAIVSIAAGLFWKPKTWLICAVLFYGLFAFFFTTMFTNPSGIVSGLVGTLNDLISQQYVRRGAMPDFVYLLVQLPIYEYLPVIGSIFAGIAGVSLLWRARRQSPHQSVPLQHLPFMLFVGLWAVLIQMAFTIAGQKMPWLVMNMVIPMIFLTGWYLGGLLESLLRPVSSTQNSGEN